MLFNSFAFAAFFAVVYGIYLLCRRWPRLQNRLLLAASWFFYGYWDWRFLALLAIPTVLDYHVARAIHRAEEPRRRRRLLALSVSVNLTLLGFFKYFDFFTESVTELLNLFGLTADAFTLGLAVPVGLSFYVFQVIGYTVDVYRRRLAPCEDPFDFALFVSFFPQLVAGPIERASRLLPQIQRPRTITVGQVDSGLFLILWGLFKKVVVADNLGAIVQQVFAQPGDYAGLDLIVATLAFSMQIYGDFSGYSDMARGLARLMGFELTVNFRLPNFARSPQEFWRRWHVSLSAWLRDYLYISLGGSQGSRLRTLRNLFLTMLLGGLWHGAAWHWVLWGGFHGAALAVHRVLAASPLRHRAGTHALTRFVWAGLGLIATFVVVQIGWLLFRAPSAAQAFDMLGAMGMDTGRHTADYAWRLLYFSAPVLLMQAVQHRSGDLLVATRLRAFLRGPLYALLLIAILVFGVRESMEFIYYQF